jgi:hypothetical protein
LPTRTSIYCCSTKINFVHHSHHKSAFTLFPASWPDLEFGIMHLGSLPFQQKKQLSISIQSNVSAYSLHFRFVGPMWYSTWRTFIPLPFHQLSTYYVNPVKSWCLLALFRVSWSHLLFGEIANTKTSIDI